MNANDDDGTCGTLFAFICVHSRLTSIRLENAAMRCHQHLQNEAVAICVSCGRGLCRDCHQTSPDQRTLCDLPQCADFARKQKALQIAIRQSCANDAETRFQLGTTLNRLAWILLVPGLGLIAIVAVAGGYSGFSGNLLSLLIVAIALVLVGWVLQRLRKGLTAQAQNWDDICREFD